jgi:hypothetical protein
MTEYREIDFGFQFGAAKVTRCMSDSRAGWVVVAVDTPKTHVQVYVTKTGKVRVYTDKKELK